ncbi:hypothetical protein PENTCL1PPCAC_2840 [Pristionchus entomophagus]|uniref:Uncharacterized protein n=1 Tax=Pristionchus entomophagus TaxID=358040 RepID=A0AAV5SE21_9BILA|nr:hypothetical protein PENTCL1PPCAC_2840 [Pristionchus entomophagus]
MSKFRIFLPSNRRGETSAQREKRREQTALRRAQASIMGRSGNPVLTEEQKKKISMRGGGGSSGGPPRRGRGGGPQGRGGRGGGGGGGPPGGRNGGGPPGGRNGGGGGGGGGGYGGPPQPQFAQARYGFFSNDMPSGPIGHINKQFVDSRPPVNHMMTPSASSVGGGDRPIRPPNGGLIFPPPIRGASGGGGDEGNWPPPVGPPRPLIPSLSRGGDGGSNVYGGGGGGMPSGDNGAAAAARSGAAGTIHELFGKMVWKKMEALDDPTEVDTLQNEIMDLIAKAVKKQQERKAREDEGNSETIPYGRPHAANNNGDAPAYGNVAEFGGYKPYQGPGFF